MDVMNCPRCGRVFTRINKPVCPACVKEDEETFEIVRAYIKENPSCNMHDISEATHVPAKRITQYIRDGRLEITSGMSAEITCTQCGKPILSGRFCKDCARDIQMKALSKNDGKKPMHEEPDFNVKRTGTMHVNRV